LVTSSKAPATRRHVEWVGTVLGPVLLASVH
jgi:hypothetical protein